MDSCENKREARGLERCTKIGKICNPKTGLCVIKTGRIGKNLLKKKKSRRSKSLKKKKSRKKKSVKRSRRRKKSVKRSRRRKKSVKKSKSRRKINRSMLEKGCIERSNFTLRAHQRKVVEYLDKHDGIIAIHGTGTGKTLTAVTASQCFLDKNPGAKVIVVSPAALVHNFAKELENYSNYKNRSRYEFYSFSRFLNMIYKNGERNGPPSKKLCGEKNPLEKYKPVNLKGNMLIVDEAHNLRNMSSKRTSAVALSAYTAKKRLILTATPFVNDVTDLIPLINMVYGKTVVCRTKSKRVKYAIQNSVDGEMTPETIHSLKTLLKGKIHFVTIGKDNKDFPQKRLHTVQVEMTRDFYKKYKDLMESKEVNDLFFDNPKRFYNGYRQLVNSVGSKEGVNYYSMKIEHAKKIIRTGKTILYTNWLKFGVVPISLALENMGVKFKIVSGDVSQKERIQIVKDFNNNELQVLILTKAGGEGLDLKEVRNVIIVDPPWNPAGLDQIIGRAIRYKSHENLPESQRFVDVYFMELALPSGMEGIDDIYSGDQILYAIVEKKIKIKKELHRFFEKLQI